jgi:Flp pilus assembly protein TadG
MPRREPPARDEEGSALVEVVWLSLVLMVPLVYILMSVFDVQRGAFAVSAASRAAGRAFTLADSDAEGEREARAAAELALADQGMDDADLSMHFSCSPDPHDCHARGSVVTVELVTNVTLPLAPAVLGGDAASFRLESVHRVPRGKYVD